MQNYYCSSPRKRALSRLRLPSSSGGLFHIKMASAAPAKSPWLIFLTTVDSLKCVAPMLMHRLYSASYWFWFQGTLIACVTASSHHFKSLWRRSSTCSMLRVASFK